MPELVVEVIVPAPPERVWEVLADFAAYGEWHPYETITGNSASLSQVRVTGRKLGSSQTLEQNWAFVVKSEPGRRLDLLSGNLLLWWSRRFFHLAPHPQGTLLRHGVKMSGLLAKRAFARTHKIERLQPYYDALGEALIRRVYRPRTAQPSTGNRRQRRAAKAGPK